MRRPNFFVPYMYILCVYAKESRSFCIRIRRISPCVSMVLSQPAQRANGKSFGAHVNFLSECRRCFGKMWSLSFEDRAFPWFLFFSACPFRILFRLVCVYFVDQITAFAH